MNRAQVATLYHEVFMPPLLPLYWEEGEERPELEVRLTTLEADDVQGIQLCCYNDLLIRFPPDLGLRPDGKLVQWDPDLGEYVRVRLHWRYAAPPSHYRICETRPVPVPEEVPNG